MMGMQSLKSRPFQVWLLDIGLLVAIAILWSLPTILNNFPLSYYDTAYYLFNAKNLSNPTFISWRPLTYSFFISIPFFKLGPLALIIFQNFVLSTMLFIFLRLVTPAISRKHLFLASLLLFLTPLVYTSNFIMPDVFTGMTFLFAISFFFGKKEYRLLSFTLALFSTFMHYSNLFILAPILILWIPKIREKKVWVPILLIFMFLGIRFATTAPRRSFEQTAHFFLFSRLTHYQITRDYFHNNCADLKNNYFCEHPNRVFNIWNKTTTNVEASKVEILDSIVNTNQAIMGSHLMVYYAWLSIKQSAFQMINFYQPMVYILEDEPLNFYYMLYKQKRHFEGQKIFNKKDVEKEFQLTILSLIYFLVITFSFFGLIFLLMREQLSRKFESIFYAFLTAYFFHSLAIGFFSEPLGRYNTRFVWVLPLLFFIAWIDSEEGVNKSRILIKK